MDLGFIADWFHQVNVFFQFIWDFLSNGIYDFFKDALVVFVKGAVYSYFQFKLFMLDIAYSAATEIMQETGFTQVITSAWGALPADVHSTLSFFNVPQGLNLVFAAIPTRFAMKFLPGMGG